MTVIIAPHTAAPRVIADAIAVTAYGDHVVIDRADGWFTCVRFAEGPIEVTP